MLNTDQLIARRTKAYQRAVVDCKVIEHEIAAYESANDGFLSYELIDKIDKATNIQSIKYRRLFEAENMCATP